MVPRNKYERTRARSLDDLGIRGSSVYLRTHCWIKIASRADVRLSTRLSAQTVLTQTMEVVGEWGEWSPELGDSFL